MLDQKAMSEIPQGKMARASSIDEPNLSGIDVARGDSS